MGKLNSKKILLLGSTGFIGKNLLEYLKEKNKFLILAPSHEELDLLDESAVQKYFQTYKPDIVINCVVVGGSRKEEYERGMFKDNMKIFLNIVQNEKYFRKMIHLGSGAEYDKSKDIKKVKETEFGKSTPEDEYGFYKYVCSKYIENSEKIYCLRIFGLYGKYEDWKYRFISNAICRSLYSKPITLNQNVFFDYVYIKDFFKIVDFFIRNNPKHKFYNIGSGKPISILELARKINSIAPKKSKIIVKKPGMNKEYTCDNSRLKKETKVFFTDVDTCIKELYEWYQDNKGHIDTRLL